MKHNYATVFDSNYLAKGIAMIRSLLKHSSPGKAGVSVLTMDEETEAALERLSMVGVAVYPLRELDADTGVLELKKTRTHQEFCWSMGSIFTDWKASRYKLDEVTYLDADVFFFSDPEVVFDEIGEKSIGITPHRFAKADEARLLPNGKYAVQWVTFKGEVGRKCLSRWSTQVREWCKYEHSEGRFGDQKYLDSWPTDYPGEVCEIANPGVGLAPWNLGRFSIKEICGKITVDFNDLVLYHFHEFLADEAGNPIRLTGWQLYECDKDLIYAPYIKAIEEAQELINATVHLQAH